MTFYESLFIIQLLFLLGVILIQFYNILNLFIKPVPTIEQENNTFFPYDIKLSFIFFALGLILFMLGFIISMYQFDIEIFITLLAFERFLLLLNVLFFIIEMISLVVSSSRVAVKAFQSKPRN